jgi:spore maturation protein CgeB
MNEVADAISYLTAHPRERAEMSRIARETVCKEFHIEKQMAQVLRALLD